MSLCGAYEIHMHHTSSYYECVKHVGACGCVVHVGKWCERRVVSLVGNCYSPQWQSACGGLCRGRGGSRWVGGSSCSACWRRGRSWSPRSCQSGRSWPACLGKTWPCSRRCGPRRRGSSPGTGKPAASCGCSLQPEVIVPFP